MELTEKEILIIEAATRLFAKDGIGVPTARIAKEAGVSNGTLFNYFETKQALIDGVYLYIKENMAKEVLENINPENHIEDILLCLWHSVIHWACRNPLNNKVLDCLYSSQQLGDEAVQACENLFAVILEAAEQAVQDDIVTGGAPSELLSEIAHAQLGATIYYIQRNEIKESEIDKVIQSSFRVFWNGIAA